MGIVCPLRQHGAASVAAAFTVLCLRWGAPDVVGMDNGTEFVNAIVESLFRLLGIRSRRVVPNDLTVLCLDLFARYLMNHLTGVLTSTSCFFTTGTALTVSLRSRQ